jgi:hypothetical protein
MRDNTIESNNIMFTLSAGDGGCNLAHEFHVKEVRWRTGKEIIEDFMSAIQARVAARDKKWPEQDVVIAEIMEQLTEYAKQPDPSERYWFNVGQYQGSRGVVTIDIVTGEEADIEEFYTHQTKQPIDVKFNRPPKLTPKKGSK